MYVFPHSLQQTYETKRKEFLVELQRKEEEMRQMFVNKVKETEAELKEKEREVRELLWDGTDQWRPPFRNVAPLTGRKALMLHYHPPRPPPHLPSSPPPLSSCTRGLSS